MRHGIFIIALCFCWAATARAEDDGGGVLDGIAAIVDAGAPIAVAGIQAGADKAIASINADAAIKMTQIVSDTTKYIASDEAQVALYQAQTAQRINEENQKDVTKRLAMQLGALADARHEAEAAEQQKLAVEQQYNNARIALAMKQSSDEVMLAKEQFGIQMSILGLTASFGYGKSDRLTLTNSRFLGGTPAGAQTLATPTPGPDGNQRGLDDSSASSSNTIASSSGKIPPRPGSITAANAPKGRAMGPRSSTVPRLLASLAGGSARQAGPIASRSAGAPSRSGVRGAIANNHIPGGSFPGSPNRIGGGALVARAEVGTARALLPGGRPHAAEDAVASTSTIDAQEDSEPVAFPAHHHTRAESAAD